MGNWLSQTAPIVYFHPIIHAYYNPVLLHQLSIVGFSYSYSGYLFLLMWRRKISITIPQFANYIASSHNFSLGMKSHCIQRNLIHTRSYSMSHWSIMLAFNVLHHIVNKIVNKEARHDA